MLRVHHLGLATLERALPWRRLSPPPSEAINCSQLFIWGAVLGDLQPHRVDWRCHCACWTCLAAVLVSPLQLSVVCRRHYLVVDILVQEQDSFWLVSTHAGCPLDSGPVLRLLLTAESCGRQNCSPQCSQGAQGADRQKDQRDMGPKDALPRTYFLSVPLPTKSSRAFQNRATAGD